MKNTLEWSKNNSGNIVGSIRSENERDLSAVLEDPASVILTIAALADLQVKIVTPVTTINDPSDLLDEGNKGSEPVDPAKVDEVTEG